MATTEEAATWGDDERGSDRECEVTLGGEGTPLVAAGIAEPLAAALQVSVARVRAALAALSAEYDDRRAGTTLRRVGEGWRLYTREEHAGVVERFLVDGQRSRLTQAALETLAVIAYRQPVTRARISAVRGVNVDGVVRTLLARGLVTEAGQDTGKAGTLYRTTPLLLEKLGLQSLEELPDLAPLLPDLDELDDTMRNP